jgi:hypothetical protein
MKYLYVLVSDDSDLFLEQALLSITSLRMYMPDAFISLLVDDITEANLIEKRKFILELINEFKVITLDSKFNKKARSRCLKTSMRNHIEGNFLYIDNDTLITTELSDIENIQADIAAVLDWHLYLSEIENISTAHINNIREKDKKLGFVSTFKSNTHFNGGVLFCKDNENGVNFFNEWHKLWLYCFDNGNTNDQQSLNQANYNLGNVIYELEGIWNCQILKDGALRFLYNSRIIHYFASQTQKKPYLLADTFYLHEIKKCGFVNDDIKLLLKTPKSLFLKNARLLYVDNSLNNFFDSAIYGATKRLYYSKFGKGIEYLLSNIRRNMFTPLRKKLYK